MKKEKQLTPERRKKLDKLNAKLWNAKNCLRKKIDRRRRRNKAAGEARKINRN